MVLRQLVNDRYMMAVLPYAFGTNLDVLGAHYSIVRQAGELDERFRRRIQLAHEAQAVAGICGHQDPHARPWAFSLSYCRWVTCCGLL